MTRQILQSRVYLKEILVKHAVIACQLWGEEGGVRGQRSGERRACKNIISFLLKTVHPKNKLLMELAIHISGLNKVSKT